MAQFTVFKNAGLGKQGEPVTFATWEQVLWDQNKKEYTAPIGDLQGSGYLGNTYSVGLVVGATGTFRVRSRLGSAQFTAGNGDAMTIVVS